MKKITNLFFVFIILISTFLLYSCGEKKIIEFKTCVLNNDGSYELIVENDVESFSFLNEIVIDQNYSYFISKDDYGLDTYQTKIVPLSVGENKFYIFILDSKGKTKEKLNINITRSNPIYVLKDLHNEITILDTNALPGQTFNFKFELKCENEYLIKFKVLLDNSVSSLITGRLNNIYPINEWIDSSLINQTSFLYIHCSSNLTNSEINKLLISIEYKMNIS